MKTRTDEEELKAVLSLLYDVGNAAKGTSHTDQRYQDAEGLSLKVFFHGISSLYLSRSTTINDFPNIAVTFFDPASIAIVTRAALEAFLTFDLIFVQSKSRDEFELRYFSWKLAGLLERRSFPVSTDEGRNVQAQDAEAIVEYEGRLNNNALFSHLTPGLRKAVLKGGWRMDLDAAKSKRLSWADLGNKAGLSGLLSSYVYRYLCDWAHSGSLAVGQLWSAKTADDQLIPIEACLNVVKIAVSSTIFSYAEVFESGKPCLDPNDHRVWIAKAWREIGRSDQIGEPAEGR